MPNFTGNLLFFFEILLFSCILKIYGFFCASIISISFGKFVKGLNQLGSCV
jgi:hypothetical protein